MAGILYFVTPIDLVPDAVPGAGLLDDVTGLAFVIARLEGELARFTAWERSDAITIEERPRRLMFALRHGSPGRENLQNSCEFLSASNACPHRAPAST